MTEFKKFTSPDIYKYYGTMDKLKSKMDKENIKYIIVDGIINYFLSIEEYEDYIKRQEINNNVNVNILREEKENNEKKDITQEEKENIIKLKKKEYQKQYHKKYREEHKNKLNDKSKEYREAHKEELKNKQQIYYERNKEAILIQKRTYDAKRRLKKQQEKNIDNE
jgi:hypothetical protein